MWSPDVAPDVIVVETPDIVAIPLPPDFEPLAEQSSTKEYHLVAAQGPARLRLCLRRSLARGLDSIVIPRDPNAIVRLAATARFERAMLGHRPGPDRAGSPSTYRRLRLVQLLAIHDAQAAGADTRDLAFGLVFPRHRPLVGAIWKGSSERRHTLRLVAEARRLVTTGYRNLLRHQ